MDRNEKWDRRFLELAQFISQWSKDESTKVGSVIVRSDKSIVSCGYNGFPMGIEDSKQDYENREIKYLKVVHSEINSLLFSKEPVKGYTIYTFPFIPCPNCAGALINAGISRVVSVKLDKSDERYIRWKDRMEISRNMFKQANVELNEVQLL